MDLGGQQSAFNTALTPGAGGLGRFQGRRLELWGWIVAHLAGAMVGIPHLVAAVSYIDYGEVLSICQHAQGSSGLELPWGRSLICPPSLSHNPFISQTQVCPLPYHPQSWGGRRRWAGLLGGFPEDKPLSSSPHSFLLICLNEAELICANKSRNLWGVRLHTDSHLQNKQNKSHEHQGLAIWKLQMLKSKN